ncbi:MAG: hypothetical protein JSR58_07145 [Verrucomicrobia bacterium]|nr:hypothetical protein [Verrucomicrobiota bacterium]
MTYLYDLLLMLPLIFGAYLTMSLMKLPDLSLESAFVLGGALGALVSTLGLPPIQQLLVCLAAAFAGGSVVGMLTSTLYKRIGIPFLLAAILCNGIFHGVIQAVMGSPLLTFKGPLKGLYAELGVLSGVAVTIFVLLSAGLKRQMGYALAVYGDNPSFLERYQISSSYVVIIGSMLASGLAGVSGFLLAQSGGFVDMTMGYGIVLLTITALILGKKVVRSPSPSVKVPLLGAAIYFLLQQLLLQAGINLKYYNTFQAAVVLVLLMSAGRKKTELLGV